MVFNESKSIFMLVLLCFSTWSVSFGEEYESCKTPEDNHGECVVIKDCPSLYELIKNKPITQAATDYLRKSHCGFLGSIPKVCCRNETVFTIDKNSTNNNAPADDILPTVISGIIPDIADCGIDTGKKIVGGTATELDEFPWMALLSYELPNRHLQFACGGVLISKRYVLTAAHCLKGNNIPSTWKLNHVRLGEYNKDSDEDCIFNGFGKECLKTPPIDVRVEEGIAHEKYIPNNVNQPNDIALLRLDRDVNFTDYIKPICLPVLESERIKSYAKFNLTVAGWGQTENKSSSDVKVKLVVPVKANNECNSIYVAAGRTLTEKQLCAGGERDKDSCKGDSGGPLMTVSINQDGDTNWYAAGIVSYGPDPCGFEGWPGVYTRVSKYMGWILRHMRQ